MKNWECIDKAGKVVGRLHATSQAEALARAKASLGLGKVEFTVEEAADSKPGKAPTQKLDTDPNWKAKAASPGAN